MVVVSFRGRGDVRSWKMDGSEKMAVKGAIKEEMFSESGLYAGRRGRLEQESVLLTTQEEGWNK